MKRLLFPIAIVSGLIVFLFMIGCRESSPNEYVQIVQNDCPATNDKPSVSVPQTKPVAEVKPADAQTGIQTKPKEKLQPAAVLIVTADEAQKLNEEALIEFNKREKIRAKEMEKLTQGYVLAYYDNFKDCKNIPLSKTNEEQLLKKGYDLQEFRERKVPKLWNVDIATIPSETSFQITENGYCIVSKQGFWRLVGPHFDGMRSSFVFELSIRNNGEDDCVMSFGVHNSGLIKNGYNVLVSESIHSKETKQYEINMNVFEQFSDIAPILSIKGEAQLEYVKVYRKMHDDFTIVEGEIVERSELPDPEQSDYPDCRYTAHFVGNDIISGNPCNKELSLSIDGFKNYKILSSNQLKKGDKIKVGIVSINSISEELASIQEADDLSLFSLQSYFVNSVEKITRFSNNSEYKADHISFLDSINNEEYISIYDRNLNPAISDKAKLIQREVIKEDLERINRLLTPWTEEKKVVTNLEFEKKWVVEKQKDPPDYNRVSGTVWRNIDNSFWALPETYKLIAPNYSTINLHNIEALVAFKDFLDTQGVQLIVSLVPNYYDISARIINKDFSDVPDFRTIAIVKQLLENNIEAIYPSEEIIKNYNRHEISFFYPKDPHPGELPQEILSDMIASRLSRYDFRKELNPADFSIERMNRQETYPSKCDIGDNSALSPYTCNRFYYKNKIIQSDPNSPILVLGNSFSNTPTGNSLSELITLKALIPVAHYSISGTGILSSAFQRIFHHPETFLSNKKVLVLQVGTMHFEANVALPNFVQLDKEYSFLNGKTCIKEFKPRGNSKTIPDFTANLIEPSIFEIIAEKQVLILDDLIQCDTQEQTDKDIIVEIIYCCKANDKIQLEINNQLIPLPSVQDSFFWCKKITSLPYQTKAISIKALGPNGAFIAIGNIKIYQ